MPMINCPECGKQISDLAASCPNCGFPIGFETKKTNTNSGTNSVSQHPIIAVCTSDNEDEKNKMWEILSAITLVIFPLAPIGIAIMWIKKIPKSSAIRILGTTIFGLAFLIWFSFAFSDEDDESKVINNNTEIQQEVQEEIILEQEKEIEEDIKVEESKIEIEDKPSIEIFSTDLLNSWSEHIGEKVTVSYICDRCEDDEESIQSTYDEDARLYLRSYVDNYREFDYGEYITVTGIVDGKYATYIEIKNAHIDYFGNDSQVDYEKRKSEYDEQKRIESEEYEAKFKENVQTPTYDDLLRYPDSYRDIQIKVKVKVVKVEPDGLIFDGNIEATMNGEKVALYDGREVKEPKLRDGDSITIYGYGKGVTTVKVQDVSGVLPKTVDKYDIPAIDMRYIEFN